MNTYMPYEFNPNNNLCSNFSRKCGRCVNYWYCVDGYNEPEWPWLEEDEQKEEYRLATSLDDTTNLMINNITEKIAKLGYPKKEILKLLNLCYLQGWKIRDVYKLISEKKMSPIKILDIITHLIKDDILLFLSEKIERSEENVDELIDIYENLKDAKNYFDLPDKIINFYIIERKVANYTGEIRVEGKEEDEEENSEGKNNEVIDQLRYCIKNICTLVSGKKAYEFTQKTKNLCELLPYSERKKYVYLIKKAWELRKIDDWKERYKRIREILGENVSSVISKYAVHYTFDQFN